MDVRQQRVEFVVAPARKEKAFSQFCTEFEISRPTGYLWCSRYRMGGLEAIAEQEAAPESQQDGVMNRRMRNRTSGGVGGRRG